MFVTVKTKPSAKAGQRVAAFCVCRNVREDGQRRQQYVGTLGSLRLFDEARDGTVPVTDGHALDASVQAFWRDALERLNGMDPTPEQRQRIIERIEQRVPHAVTATT
jgi:hypothetical protein